MSLQLVVTDAGRAALVNAANTGTLPVTIAQIGVTATAFDADPFGGDMVLPGELKRLATFAGAAVADDTIHVTLRDDGADVYSLRGFALYLADGTLFALYGQAGVILEKSAQAMLLLSADVRFTQIDATSITFGDASFINPPATTDVQGVIELATNAEALTGTDTQRGIVASALKHVLDSRFGAGAPSAFVKGLLTLTTAALIRAALEIKSAALKDEGANNGLDADKVDGQHGAYYLAWANQTGVPATFAPIAHGHAWGDLSGVPSYAARWPTYDEVTGKPATFTPSGHSHDAGNIVTGVLADARIPSIAIAKTTGLQEALNSAYKSVGGDIGGGNVADPAGIKRVGGTQVGLKFSHDNSTMFFGLDAGGVFRIASSNNLAATGTVVWHSGNFDPATKADLSGANFTGLVASTGVIAADGGFSTDALIFISNPAYGGMAYGGAGAIVLYGNSAGIYLRPGGRTVTAGQAAIAPSGAMSVSGTVTAPAFAQSSSRRYKTDIESIDPGAALSLLSEVVFADYTMRADGRIAMGVIAEDLAGGPLDFAVNRNEDGEPDAVDYQPLFVLAACALQGLAARVSVLEARG